MSMVPVHLIKIVRRNALFTFSIITIYLISCGFHTRVLHSSLLRTKVKTEDWKIASNIS
jgi:hypothetical protein